MEVDYFTILLLSPFLFLNIGIKMVMPSFSALFPHSTLQFFRNRTPVFSAILSNQLNKKLILFFGLGYKIITHDPLTIELLPSASLFCLSMFSLRSTNF